MRILKLAVVVMAVIVAIASVKVFIANIGADIGPTIHCSVEGNIETPTATTDAELLKLVTASDEQDGDLTADIQIVRKNYFVSDKTSVITYSVCDSDNNVCTLQKNIVYTDYTSPRFSFKSDFIFQTGSHVGELSSFVMAYDMFDGDVSSYVKLISAGFTSVKGQYPINIKVSNDMGDTEEITINAIVTNSYSNNIRINLSKYLIYYDGNPNIDWKSYIDGVSGTENYDVKDVEIDTTDLDLTKPGVRNVYFKLMDGNRVITYTRIFVVVKEV